MNDQFRSKLEWLVRDRLEPGAAERQYCSPDYDQWAREWALRARLGVTLIDWATHARWLASPRALANTPARFADACRRRGIGEPEPEVAQAVRAAAHLLAAAMPYGSRLPWSTIRDIAMETIDEALARTPVTYSL